MSEVISFRLDRENPREAKALDVLKAWVEDGFSIRHILTTALLELDHSGSDSKMSQGDPDWDAVLNQLGQLLEIAEAAKPKPVTKPEISPVSPVLQDSFLVSIKQGVKPGIKLE